MAAKPLILADSAQTLSPRSSIPRVFMAIRVEALRGQGRPRVARLERLRHTVVTGSEQASGRRAMGSRILVVEDEPDLAELVALNLRGAGHEVVVCHDGSTALAEVQRSQPDLLVLDVMLPDVSGVEVCRRLRRSAETARIPVIMLTAKNEEIDKITGLSVGADDYLTKPFNLEELLLRVNNLIKRSSKAPGNTPEIYSFGENEINFRVKSLANKSKGAKSPPFLAH